RVRVTLRGAQLLATLREGTRMIPGAKSREDLLITTSGTLIFHDITESGGEPRVLMFPEPIRLSSSDSAIASESASITLREVAAFVADTDIAKKETFPSRIQLVGDVRGHSPLGTFEADHLDYERTFDSAGAALKDRVLLSGNPQFLWRSVALGSNKPQDAPLSKNLLSQDSDMVVSATQTLEIELDPLRIDETRAKAIGAVVVRSLGTDRDPVERARISADSMDLRIVEEWRAEVDDVGMTQRFVSRREVRWAEALGQVRFSDRDRLRGEGDQLTYQQGESKLMLRSEGELALFELKDRHGKIQRMEANDLIFFEASGELEAKGSAKAALFLEPLGYGKGRSRDPVATDVKGPMFRAKLGKVAGADASEDWKIQELRAEGGMLLTQISGSRLNCNEFIGNLTRSEILIRGNPAELVITQRVGEQDLPERIVSPSLSLTDNQVLVQGPLEATFFARRRDLATAMPGGPSTQEEAIPMHLAARQDLLLADNRLSVRGAATLSQGNPGADGFKLSGERFTLTLEGPPPNAVTPEGKGALGNLRVIHAIAMGAVSFLSRDLTGEGDVMEFDLTRKTVSLFRYRNEGNATLTWRSQWQSPFPRFNVDYSRPENPILSTSRTVPERDHR
ncbi:MAG TPA: hypothetical protein PKA37_05845, partial [Planctomycetota bacterium]|nr:hypothetical protein [Planctomycetota bacterium]